MDASHFIQEDAPAEISEASSGPFPWGTLTVNVAGSLFLGFLLVWFQASLASAELRALVTIGVLGSFTTFSTFTYETGALLQDGEWTRAMLNVLASLVLGLVAVLLGAVFADLLLQPRR